MLPAGPPLRFGINSVERSRWGQPLTRGLWVLETPRCHGRTVKKEYTRRERSGSSTFFARRQVFGGGGQGVSGLHRSGGQRHGLGAFVRERGFAGMMTAGRAGTGARSYFLIAWIDPWYATERGLMITVRFTARMHGNTIRVPKAYKGFNNTTVGVILMKDEGRNVAVCRKNPAAGRPAELSTEKPR
jgi:hypothetical protein